MEGFESAGLLSVKVDDDRSDGIVEGTDGLEVWLDDPFKFAKKLKVFFASGVFEVGLDLVKPLKPENNFDCSGCKDMKIK